MSIYRCRICGEVFIGEQKPSDCPFCGVPNKYLILGDGWKDENRDVKLTETSRKNLKAALKLELNATSLYFRISDVSNNMAIKSMFKGIAKIEREHASLLGKILQIPKLKFKKIDVKRDVDVDDKAMLKKTTTLENNAVKEYINGASEAAEQRVKDIFFALANVEKVHLDLANEILKKIKLATTFL